MTDHTNARERYRNARTITVPTHKYDVGARVAYKAGASSERSPFRVTRLLPDGGQGLQYRIRSDRDGQERVVIETALERAAV